MDIWQLLEQDAPDGCEPVQDLYSWSLNCDPGKGPFTLFLDLTGYSDEPVFDMRTASLGYVELGKLADALNAYADRPHDVRAYVETLLQAEFEL